MIQELLNASALLLHTADWLGVILCDVLPKHNNIKTTNGTTLPIEAVQVFWRGMILMSKYVTAMSFDVTRKCYVIRQSYLSLLAPESYRNGYTMQITSNMRG